MLAALAWRNLWRRPQRTVLSLAAIALVTALMTVMLSFQAGVYGAMKEATLRLLDGYAQFQPAGYLDDPTPDRVIDHPDDLIAAARRAPGVAAVSPRVVSFVLASSRDHTTGTLVMGVNAADEKALSSLPRDISAGRYLAPDDQDAAVVGAGLARKLGVGLGDRVTLLGAGRDGASAADALTVVGIIASGSPDLDRGLMVAPLARMQDAFAMEGAVTTIALAGDHLSSFDAASSRLLSLAQAHGVRLIDWGGLEPALRDTITSKYATASLFGGVLIIVVAFIITNTLLMAVMERTHEFGVLMALGMTPGRVGAMVWLELVFLTLLGCLAGLLIGGGAGAYLQAVGVVYPIDPRIMQQFNLPQRLFALVTPFTLLFGPAVMLLAITIGGLAPYGRVRRLSPDLAMRR
jgi:putative ABC transport system permease protein